MQFTIIKHNKEALFLLFISSSHLCDSLSSSISLCSKKKEERRPNVTKYTNEIMPQEGEKISTWNVKKWDRKNFLQKKRRKFLWKRTRKNFLQKVRRKFLWKRSRQEVKMNESTTEFDPIVYIGEILGPERALPLSWMLVLTSVYIVIFLMGTIGNILVVIVILKFRFMRENITNLYLCNLAVTDLLSITAG